MSFYKAPVPLMSRNLIANIDLAKYYTSFLSWVNWNDRKMVDGLKEPRSHFLSNFHIESSDLWLPVSKLSKPVRSSYRGFGRKIWLGHYYSSKAIEAIDKQSKQVKLRFEHIVPQRKYIIDHCESNAKIGTVNLSNFVDRTLNQKWLIAIITEEEQKAIDKHYRDYMPSDHDKVGAWDGVDIFERFRIKNSHGDYIIPEDEWDDRDPLIAAGKTGLFI